MSEPLVTGMTLEQIKAERGVRWVYNWLFWSMIVLVPWTLIRLQTLPRYGRRAASVGDWLLAVLLPALPHLILLLQLRSPYRYVRRHTQQALGLVGCSLLVMVFVALTRGGINCIWGGLFLGIWTLPVIWGRPQVRRGDCWLMRVKGEGNELPRPWAERPAAAIPAIDGLRDPHLVMGRAQVLRSTDQQERAVSYLLHLFRHTTGDLRQQALDALDQMGEVETF